MATKGKHLLVAAIDFGTTFSGYAFSFKTDPENIICNKNWGQPMGFQSYKTPTSILTNSSGEFVAMGYDAEQQYNQNSDDEGATEQLHLYRHFKMALHSSKKLNLKSAISSEDGTIARAVTIFGFAIDYLRQHLLKAISDHTATSVDASSIKWVITVPAIWSEPAKQFMRHAAKLGGCIEKVSSENIILALEPEAASMCCRRPTLAGYRAKEISSLSIGAKYMLLDCGGGTVDISVHQIESGGKVKEILPASGGPWGGVYVDRKFAELIADIFGKDFLNRYRAKYPQDWLDILQSFESMKKPFDGSEKAMVKIRLPWSFGEFHTETFMGKSIKDTVKSLDDKNISFANGSITFKSPVVQKLFSEFIDATVNHTRMLLSDPSLDDCKYIFMVGGFSDSRLLQQEVKLNFEGNGLKVLVPSDAQTSVLRGAVLFGHNHDEIVSRIAKRTYGFMLSNRFDSNIHDPMKAHVNEYGVKRCDIMTILIKKGETIDIGNTVVYKTFPVGKFKATLRLYSKDGEPAIPIQYIEDDGVELLGFATLKLPENPLKRGIFNHFTFGETEIKVKRVHEESGDHVETIVDLLPDLSGRTEDEVVDEG